MANSAGDHLVVCALFISRQVIAEVGDSGSLSGAHLYFEIRQGAKPLDPERWLDGLDDHRFESHGEGGGGEGCGDQIRPAPRISKVE